MSRRVYFGMTLDRSRLQRREVLKHEALFQDENRLRHDVVSTGSMSAS